jgi:hypothetical protein
MDEEKQPNAERSGIGPPDVDLFGNSPPPPKPKNRVGGYAHQPGTGPEGETCRWCMHRVLHTWHDRNYYKCDLVKPTHGPGTDIRLKSPACWEWNPGTEYIEEKPE